MMSEQKPFKLDLSGTNESEIAAKTSDSIQPGDLDVRAKLSDPGPLESPVAENQRTDGSLAHAVIDSASSGAHLAQALEQEGFQPVVVFGNAASGKTSLLLSLFAAIKTAPELKTTIALSPEVFQGDTPYNKHNLSNSERFLNLMTQQFINGETPAATRIGAPFFIPIVFSPVGGPSMKFAFMESDGEWYRPDFEKGELYPKLKEHIEQFIATYQKGIIFLHLNPYTQLPARSAKYDQQEDTKRMQVASLAIDGALQNYRAVRLNQQDDQHLMLVTKWDARNRDIGDMSYALQEDAGEVEHFLSTCYAQAYSTYQGLEGRVGSRLTNAYCAGLMNDEGILHLRPNNDMRADVLKYPKNLWTWLYRAAWHNAGTIVEGPFPTKKVNIFQRVINWLLAKVG